VRSVYANGDGPGTLAPVPPSGLTDDWATSAKLRRDVFISAYQPCRLPVARATLAGMDTSPIRDLPPVKRPQPVEPCFRCGRAAEEPSVGFGHLAGREEERIPLCIDCLATCINDPQAFWAGMKGRE
jgi:hypothetical protein